MKIKRLCLLLGVVLLFCVCFFYMNQHFDRLSRYPYENQESRAKIDRHLNDEEIEYIIEYSIAPVEFIEYIESPIFNIYHIATYNRFSDLFYYLSPNEVVDFCEEIIRLNKVEEAAELAQEYYFSDILFWLNNGDVYNPNGILIANPNDVDAYVDETYTISNRVPYQLVDLDFINTGFEEIQIRDIAYEPLKIMCDDMDYQLGTSGCGNLRVYRGYVSYSSQEQNYNPEDEDICNRDLPGHSEHQLGLAIDLYAPYARDFNTTYAYRWLSKHAHEYGFAFNYDERINHLRYIGQDLATKMQDESLTFKEVCKP